MHALATTKVSILRGNDAVDEYLDTEPSDTLKYKGIIASLQDRRRVVATQDSPEPLIVSYTDCKLPSGTDVQYGDRIKDERTGTLYKILDMNQNQNPMNTPDLVLQLSRVRDYGTT